MNSHNQKITTGDKEEIARLYYDEGMSLNEVGEEFGCSDTTIRNWMDKFGMEREDPREASANSRMERPANYTSNQRGYQLWETHYDGETSYFYVHRLLAIAKYGVDAVKDNIVHHENEIKWDNRPDNITVMSQSEHVKEHHLRNTMDMSND